jgi:hypothetical protein
MAEVGSGGANRIELESQILCASLRQSWAINDTEGVITVARQLYQLFPDLLPAYKPGNNGAPDSLYDFLNTVCDAPQTSVIAAYLRAIKRYLRSGEVKELKDEYIRVLNAGYILRKPRLRLSHDLIIVRQWLLDQGAIPEDGTIDFVQPSPVAEPAPLLHKTQQIPLPKLPPLVELLRESQMIGPAEVQALVNQMHIAPEIPVQELVLSAGYVSDLELKSLQLAEYLLGQGKITMAQFAVAMYDERTQGVRMAESLQNRGWLETEVKSYGDDRKSRS